MAQGHRWLPDPKTVSAANLTGAIADLEMDGYDEFHAWAASHRAAFWRDAIERIGIVLDAAPRETLDDRAGPESAVWLPGAELNIAASCFDGDPERPAAVSRTGGEIRVLSSGQLRDYVMRVAAGLIRSGYGQGDRIAIAMPMTVDAVAAYLGIVWIGGVVVSIADSFAADEIEARLRITGATTVVTQDVSRRDGKELPMYQKVVEAGAQRAIVIETGAAVNIRAQDIAWVNFLGGTAEIEPVTVPADAVSNILFSSGTTGDPKAIPWTHVTPIKAATDGYYHQDIHPDDVVAWPTNLGWMMGPWLIYASLINGASMALFDDAPTGEAFGRFVQDAGVTILGVVPSLVASWRSSGCMEDVDWSGIRLFSSTGETSRPSDMAYLMGLAGGRPVIEYCGGTEIGGGYLTGTVIEPAVPSMFSTPALGLDVRILDDDGQDASSGELFLVPPSIGFSSSLLNGDHHEVYYAGAPRPDGVALRRHGDYVERFEDGYYRALGRVDDTMNLGGIKISSAGIERVAGAVEGISEVAAVAVPPAAGGPSLLVIYAVANTPIAGDEVGLRRAMQAEIRSHLNPLFRVHEVVVVDSLPRTASAKVMRRSLRDAYTARASG